MSSLRLLFFVGIVLVQTVPAASAQCEPSCILGLIGLGLTDDAKGPIAISGTGDAAAHSIAVSGTGDAYGLPPEDAGAGDSEEEECEASSEEECRCDEDGSDEECDTHPAVVAVSGTGDAHGFVAVSGTGHARGTIAVGGGDL